MAIKICVLVLASLLAGCAEQVWTTDRPNIVFEDDRAGCEQEALKPFPVDMQYVISDVRLSESNLPVLIEKQVDNNLNFRRNQMRHCLKRKGWYERLYFK